MDPVIAGLSALVKLTDQEESQIRGLNRVVDRYPQGTQLGRIGRGPQMVGVIVSGWACEQRILIDGRRQIFSFLLPGDTFVMSSKSSLGTRAVVALTSVEAADATPLFRGSNHEGLGSVLEITAALREERLFDHIVRLGRQSAYQRMVHLLLELRDRLEIIGQVRSDSFRIPLTQETFADTLGLSIVHVNRTLKQLRREQMIELKGGGVTLLKPKALSVIAGHEHDRDERPASPRWGNTPLSTSNVLPANTFLQPNYDFS